MAHGVHVTLTTLSLLALVVHMFAFSLTVIREGTSSFHGCFDSVLPAALDAPAVTAITSRCTCITDTRIAPPAIHPAHVRVTLKNGEVRALYSATMKGSPAAPMMRDEVTEKYRACLRNWS